MDGGCRPHPGQPRLHFPPCRGVLLLGVVIDSARPAGPRFPSPWTPTLCAVPAEGSLSSVSQSLAKYCPSEVWGGFVISGQLGRQVGQDSILGSCSNSALCKGLHRGLDPIGRDPLWRGLNANGYSWKALRQKEWLMGEPAAAAVCPGCWRKNRVLVGWLVLFCF